MMHSWNEDANLPILALLLVQLGTYDTGTVVIMN